MKSFDLFGTLIAGRDTRKRDGDQDGHFPIAETVARVERHDLVISDYYDAARAQRLLKEVAGLDNALLVSPDGKASGAVWDRLINSGQCPTLHLGDDMVTDIASAQSRKIRTQLVELGKMTAIEREMEEFGFPGLAHLMRETRLACWDDDTTMRCLQLFQAQANLPFLFLATLTVHRRMDKFRRLLMCARDCWLWSRLYNAMMHQPGFWQGVTPWYEAFYFPSSRLMRYFPSENYRAYIKEQYEHGPVLVVDTCGFGTSLHKLLGDQATALLLVGYGDCAVDFLLRGWMNETSNFARHPMIADLDKNWNEVYANPMGIDWTGIPELNVMHQTFLRGVGVLSEYDFGQDFSANNQQIRVALETAFGTFENPEYVEGLSALTPLRRDEAQATADLLAMRGVNEIVT